MKLTKKATLLIVAVLGCLALVIQWRRAFKSNQWLVNALSASIKPEETFLKHTSSSTTKRIINITFNTPRPHVELFINLPVAAHQVPRRNVIRATWLSTIKDYSVAYRFFTDGVNIDPGVRKRLNQEQEQHKDLVLLPTKPGYWYSHRYLFAMFWGYQHYNFSYYLRVDDDYFVCLNNLVNDLQYRKNEKLLYWGNMGCDPKMVAMDEGFLLVSLDIVNELIYRNDSLLCHPMGGQMIAMWINRLEREGLDVTYFADNTRLMHYKSQLKKTHNDMCKELIGIHETYPLQMAQYWNMTKTNWYTIKPGEFVKVERKPYEKYCSQPKGWDWRVLNEHWRHEPKPCWDPNLRWPELEKFKHHKGRE